MSDDAPRVHPGMTVGEYLEHWLDTHVRPNLARSTQKTYIRSVRQWWSPRVGRVRLDALTLDHLQAVINEMAESGLAASTIKVDAMHIRSALEKAVANRLLDRNPMTKVRLPRRKPRRYVAMSQDEAQRFMTACLMPSGVGGYYWYGPMLVCALLTGMRAGELRGLRWGNVYIDGDADEDDELAGVISVVEQVYTGEKRPVFTEPKSASSVREIPIGHDLATILGAQRERLDRHALRLGTRKWREGRELDLVFPSKKGSIAHTDAAREQARSAAEMAGLDEAPNFVVLRHTYASLMVDGGVRPEVVANLLGHTNVALTINTYYQTTPPAQREALISLRDALRGK